MAELDVVGVTEHYAESVCLIVWRATGVLPSHCLCDSVESMVEVHKTHGVPEHSLSDISNASRALIATLTRIDVQVHEAATTRFLRDVRAMEAAVGQRVLCSE